MSKQKWLRCRFHANEEDFRPVKFPPPGPYWCTGYGDGFSVIVAYVRKEEQVTEFWPEANTLEVDERDEITYTDRFPKPEWYKGDEA